MSRKSQPEPRSFEEAIGELERIVADIESGGVPLEEGLQKYQRGAFLIQHCRIVLDAAEKQVEQLSKSADGKLVSSPLETSTQPTGS